MNKTKRYKQKYGKQFKKKQLWDLHTYLSKTILINLKAFRNLELHSVPPVMDECENIPYPIETHAVIKNNQNDPSIKQWKEIIDKMIFSFSEIAYGCPNDPVSIAYDKSNLKYLGTSKEDYVKPSEEEIKKYNDKIDEGLRLFVKYLRDLWD